MLLLGAELVPPPPSPSAQRPARGREKEALPLDY